jgi:hypothetical protein
MLANAEENSIYHLVALSVLLQKMKRPGKFSGLFFVMLRFILLNQNSSGTCSCLQQVKAFG